MVAEGAISEVEAVKQAGVSARTLQRFCEAGYLTVQVKGDGTRLYAVQQLHEIFGSFQETPSQATTSNASSRATVASTPVESDGPSCSNDAASYYTPVEPTPMVERVALESEKSVAQATNSNKLLEEHDRLKNLVALQERILDMKDSEITDLRSQRDWLKARVEKLEEKGDRDQILLLSETQALRQMIGLQQKRSSTLRSLLDWLGLGNSESVPALPSNHDVASGVGGQNPIVVNKAANN